MPGARTNWLARTVVIPAHDETWANAPNRSSAPAERGRPGNKGVTAFARPTHAAETARPAGDGGPDDHGIAGMHRRDALPHPVDDPGRFMAGHHRQRHRVLAIDHVEVAVADPRGEHPERHLPGTGLSDFQLVGDDQVDAIPTAPLVWIISWEGAASAAAR